VAHSIHAHARDLDEPRDGDDVRATIPESKLNPMPTIGPAPSGTLKMAIKTLEDLFLHALSDIYSAEKQLTKALPKMAKAATNPALAAAFTAHLGETEGQVERIDSVVGILGIKLQRIKCVAMEGLVKEGAEAIDEIEDGAVLDAGLINAAQKVEHYEIASYGTLCALGRQLGYDEAVELLQETLAEEKSTDEKLTILAEGQTNPDADRAVAMPSGKSASKATKKATKAKQSGAAKKAAKKK
jgi:ferritin-like metal-binding protein YciE